MKEMQDEETAGGNLLHKSFPLAFPIGKEIQISPMGPRDKDYLSLSGPSAG
jgi:hypothetical protein